MNQEALEDIDNHITTWTDRINDSTDRTTPTIQYKVLPGAQPNRHIKRLQRTYKRLMTIKGPIHAQAVFRPSERRWPGAHLNRPHTIEFCLKAALSLA